MQKSRLSNLPSWQLTLNVWEPILPLICFPLSKRPLIDPIFGRFAMHQIIYLVGLIVVIMFILSVLGLR